MDRRVFLGGLASFAALPTRTLGESRERLVIAGGDLTEIAFALGAGERVVGVDTTSKHPASVTGLPQIGYLRRLSAEGVLSLAPTQLLLAADAGPPPVLDQLRAAGVALSIAPDANTPTDVPDKIAFVGDALGLSARAAQLSNRYMSDLEAVSAKVREIETRPKVLFVLSVKNGAPLVGGEATSADAMIRAAGGVNAVSGFESYKPMSAEAILAARPNVILMMREHAERLGGAEAVLARPDIALTPAGKNGALVSMDGMLLLGFGPRTPEAVARLARLLHPAEAVALDL